MDSKNIVLIGFMGTGKTSVGKILATKLNRKLLDVDQRIEEKEKRKISDIFKKEGEAHFRVLERDMISHLAKERGAVITTGGGAVLDGKNMEALRQHGVLISLLASPATIYKRVKNSRHRPLLDGENMMANIEHLWKEREPLYRNADEFIETDGCTSTQVAKIILEKLKGRL